MTPSVQTEAERISRIVFDYASRIVREQNTDRLLLLNANLARNLTRADRCSIWLIDEHNGELWTKVAHGSGQIRIPYGQGLVGACIERDEPIVINDAHSDPRFLIEVDRESGYDTQSVVTLPLRRVDGQVMGAIQVLNKSGGFTDSDVEILGLASCYSAAALESQRLRDMAESARLFSRELEIARDVQFKLLPQNIPTFAGMTYEAFCRPARFVGGDYYDVLALPDGSVAFTLGDVSGKGIAAAMLMASIQSSLRVQLLRPPESLSSLLNDLNVSVHAASTADKYTTLFCGLIAADRSTLTYVSAAQVAPILVRRGKAVRLDESDMPLGMFRNVTYEQRTLPLESGDLLICFSDGLSECTNAMDDFWDEDEIERIALSASSVDVVDTLIEAADRFAGGAKQSDDITVVAIQINASIST